jgi:hypothetical protein
MNGIDYQPVDPTAPRKTPFQGVHFSDSDIKGGVLHGARRGSSPLASDAHRVRLGRGAPSAVHVYRHGHVAHPSVASRKHAHSVSGNYAVANIDGAERTVWAEALTSAYKDAIASGADPQTAKLIAQNSAEHALVAQGWDGYGADTHQPGNVTLFGDIPVDGGANAKNSGNSVTAV